MTGLRAWFVGRSLREKRLILVMLALLALTVVWGLVILPVRDGLSSARSRHADAVERFAATEQAVELLSRSRRARPLTGSLADALRAEAAAAGFTVATLDEQGQGRVHLTIQSGRGAALSAWLARLERIGILVDAATLRDNGDGTLAADLVLRARAA